MLCSGMGSTADSVSVHGGVATGCRRKGVEIAEPIAHFDEVEAVPLEWLLDEQFAAKRLVERPRLMVFGDDPRHQVGRAAFALRGGDGRNQPAADPLPLAIRREVDRRELGVEAELRRIAPVRGREADDAATFVGNVDACERTARQQDALPECSAVGQAQCIEVGVGHHAAIGLSPSVDAHLRDGGGVAGLRGTEDDPGHEAVTLRTAAATFSAVNPKCLNSAPAGADSPKRSMPTTAPRGSSAAPTYLRQKSVTPASTATRGMRAGRTDARYAASWRSNTLVQGIDTTRASMPPAARLSRACSAIGTSEPVAMITARVPARAESART